MDIWDIWGQSDNMNVRFWPKTALVIFVIWLYITNGGGCLMEIPTF